MTPTHPPQPTQVRAAASKLDGNTTTFRVDGIPAPQGSKRHVGRGILVESSKALKPWRERIAWTAREHNVPLLDSPLAIELHFVMPRPASTPKTRTPRAVKRPDLDKLVRGVFDALTGVCFTDDSRIVALQAGKRIAEIGEGPGVNITIRELS